jgi:hypothetical protein
LGVVATGGTLDHEAALACAAMKAAEKYCVIDTITVTGTLINDVDYKTNTLINAFAIIEPFAKVLMEAGEQILLQAGFEVKSGAGFEANNQDCKTNSEAGNKNR